MKTAKPAARPRAARRLIGHAGRWALSVVSGAVLAAYGAWIVALAAYERIRYGRHEAAAEVYPGVIRVRTPSGEWGES